MRIATPIITLIVGIALAAALFLSDVTSVSARKAALASVSASASAAVSAAPSSSALSATPAVRTSPSAGTAASPSSAASGFVIPPHANYDGQVQGNLGAVALVVHDTFAVAYFCNGSTQEAWFKGTPHNGVLNMTGKAGATLDANYALGHARGTVTVDGIQHVFSIIAVHKPSGLFQSIAVVRGATVKAGWIVLPDGTTEIGSMMPDSLAASPASVAAPKLNLATLTANDGGTSITAKPIDGETGSGF